MCRCRQRKTAGRWQRCTRDSLRLSECEILDTWFTIGLRGTDSNDLRVDDVFVATERTFSFQDPALIKRPGPLYAFPFMFITKGSAPALGDARHAIDALVDTASRKPARLYTLGERLEAPKTMRDDVFVQEAVGRAETMLASARAYQSHRRSLEHLVQRWRADAAADRLGHDRCQSRHRCRFRGRSIGLQGRRRRSGYQTGPFDRCLRDILTMNQHLMATLRTYEMAGRLLLGLEPLKRLL